MTTHPIRGSVAPWFIFYYDVVVVTFFHRVRLSELG